MGLQADAVAIAKLTGKDVRECKKALKDAGESLRNKSIEEKAAALFGAAKAAPPPPPPPVEKAIDPPVEKQVQDPTPVSGMVDVKPDEAPKVTKKKAKKKSSRSPKVVETNDEDDMGGKIKDEAT